MSCSSESADPGGGVTGTPESHRAGQSHRWHPQGAKLLTWWYLCSPQAVRIRTELGCRTPSGHRDAGRDRCCFCRTEPRGRGEGPGRPPAISAVWPSLPLGRRDSQESGAGMRRAGAPSRHRRGRAATREAAAPESLRPQLGPSPRGPGSRPAVLSSPKRGGERNKGETGEGKKQERDRVRAA